MFNDTQTKTIQAVAQMSVGVVKMANELKSRLAAAPKAADKDVLEKAASALISSGWCVEDQRPDIIRVLSEPTGALKTLTEIAKKAAEAIEAAATGGDPDPRLNNGRPINSPTMLNKRASEGQEFIGLRQESAADKDFLNRMLGFRQQLVAG